MTNSTSATARTVATIAEGGVDALTRYRASVEANMAAASRTLSTGPVRSGMALTLAERTIATGRERLDLVDAHLAALAA